jgi:enamine deaminase RidA (YjgF/YER057c/UK114 family)
MEQHVAGSRFIAETLAGDNGVERARTEEPRRFLQLKQQGPFSDGVLVGETLYLSGCIGLDESGKQVPDDIEAEARNVLEDVRSILRKADMELEDLVYVQVFCPDISLWERFNAVYFPCFKQNLPARAFIGSGKLLFDAHFEVQGIAIKKSRSR